MKARRARDWVEKQTQPGSWLSVDIDRHQFKLEALRGRKPPAKGHLE